MIGVKSLQYTVDTFTLSIPSLEIKEGELHVMLGPTGSGKTLLLEYIAGLLPKASGNLLIDGRQTDRLPPEARRISYVTQDLALFPHLTVRENIEFGLRFRQKGSSSALDKLIAATDISGLLDRYPANLSGGEKQRVAIVRALAPQPGMILLDEPFSALHPSLKLSLWQLVKKLHREMNLTILMVSHDVDEALALGDVISFISNGTIKQTAKRKEIYYRPKALEVARFFGFKNVFEAIVDTQEEDILRLSAGPFGKIKVAATHRETEVKAGQSLWWGIHAEEITIVKADRKDVKRQNLFSGTVTNLVEVGRSLIVSVQLDQPAKNAPALEVNLHDNIARRFKITEGQQIEVELKPDRIFLINSDSRA